MKKKKDNIETSIYIVDKEYRIVHLGSSLSKTFPHIQSGDLCYRALCGEDAPCEACPVKKEGRGSAVLFNKKIRQWIDVSTDRIDWPGVEEANILVVKAVREDNRNLFYDLTNISSYDELFELNLTKGTYKMLYHSDGKYVVPPSEGVIKDAMNEIAEKIVHPEEREAFLDFWMPENIERRLIEDKDERTQEEEFRKRLVTGGYGWVLQKVVPLIQGEKDDKIVMCFIQDIEKYKENEIKFANSLQQDEEQQLSANVGLYKRAVFLEKAEKFLAGAELDRYCLMAVDIEHFKLFNEWYGHKSGDEFLASIGAHLKKAQDEQGGIAGYMGSDDFCIILPNDREVLEQLQNQMLEYVKRYAGNAGFLPAFGIYEIADTTLSVTMMYDRAAMALASVKGNYAKRVCWYDAGMMKKMGDDHKLLTEVQRALEENEFTFFIQPKCDMKSGKIIGAESLVRWRHPERGIIPPGEFIPLLESNGFISNLDLYVWEKVCITLREWLDKGYTVLPISVNVSRIDIYIMDVVVCFKGLIEKYGLKPSMLEIEITESAYAEEHKVISHVVGRLQQEGFTVSMDDFGSGYSSLNMLKDVNVDILKIDMKFLELDVQNKSRGMEILETVISMAHLLDLRVIAEGVETKEQMDTLMEMGCAYGQGYYFYKPMEIERFGELLHNKENIEYSGIQLKKTSKLNLGDERLESSKRVLATVARIADNQEAFMRLTEENRRTAEAIFAQMTPGGMIGGYCEENFPLYFANAEMLHLLEYDSYEEFEAAIDGKVVNTIHPDDREQVAKDIGPTYYDGLEYTTTYRMPKKDGTWFWTQDKGKVIRAEDGRLAIISACTDISQSMEIQKELESKNKELLKRNEELYFLNNDIPGGYHRCLRTPGFEFEYVSNRFLDIFGYTREDIVEIFDNKYINMVHPEDRKLVEDGASSVADNKELENLEYRMLSKRGYIWVIDQSKYMEHQGRACFQGVILDVTETVQLRNQMKLLHKYTPENILLINLTEQGTEYQVLAGGMYRSLGFSQGEYEEYLNRAEFSDTLDQEDFQRVHKHMQDAMRNGLDYFDLLRKTLPNGKKIWINLKATCISKRDEEVKYLCVYGDVTYIKEKEYELWLADEKLESILKQATINCWDWNFVHREISITNVVKNKVLSALYPKMKRSRVTVKEMSLSVKDAIHIPEPHREELETFIEKIQMGSNHEENVCEFPVTSDEGETVWIKIAGETICNAEGKPVRAVGYFIDITERKLEYFKSHENIKALQKDSLTGLFNRQAAIPMIKRYLSEHAEQDAAMIMLDMDNFKVANDVFGHAYGDEIITESAFKLKNVFREDDIVCRIGGDEFLVLCKNIKEEMVAKKLESIINNMQILCKKGGREITFTVSAGYAMIPEQGREFDELYRKADVALFTAKMSGKSAFRRYDTSMKEIRYELANKTEL